MRKTILLDFLSPDNWKTYSTVPKAPSFLELITDKLVAQLKQSINVAVLLTLDHCLLPPAFIVQSKIAFSAVTESSLFLDEHKIYMPLRETSIDLYIQKKISEYAHVRDSHEGFYNEDHWNFLSRYQDLLIPRNAAMGMTIAKQWMILPNESAVWNPIITRDPRAADQLRPIPQLLKARGESVTLEAILSISKIKNKELPRFINQAIQHEYLKTYIEEYNACILSNAPPKPLNENYLIPVESQYYDFRLFASVLDILGIRDYLLFAHPEIILEFMRKAEYSTLLDIYTTACEQQPNKVCIECLYRRLVNSTGKSMPRIDILHPSCSTEVSDRINRVAEAFYKISEQNNFQEARNKMKKIAIIVATPKEYDAALLQFKKHGYTLENENYDNLFFKETFLKNEVKVYLIRIQMGATAVGGAFNMTHSVIEILNPDAIIISGICFGVQKDDGPQMNDILVSTDIWDYETAKITDGEIDFRGNSIPVSSNLWQLFDRTSHEYPVKVFSGVMGAGDKIVSDKLFLDQLLKRQPHMIGGDMEGYAVVSACQSKKKDCILVKAICDWGFDKQDEYQQPAADISLDFVITALETIKN